MTISICRLKSFLSRSPQTSGAILLALLTLFMYSKVGGHEFILNWDDAIYVAENENIRGLTFKNITHIFTTNCMGNYAPVLLFSYMLDYSLWGLKADMYIMMNVALHLGSTLLFYRLLLRFGLTFSQALVAAALFAIHPVQIESVAWISQRKNTLSMLFFLASWHSWLQWETTKDGRQRPIWYGASLLLFTLALLTKSIAVILPLFLVTQQLVFDRKPVTWRRLLAIAPYAVLAGACSALSLSIQTQGDFGIIGHYGGSMAVTMMNMLPVFSRYLTLLIFPAALSIVYNPPIKSTPDVAIVLSGALFLLFIIGWLRLWKPHRAHFFWLTLFIIGLLPVSNIIPLVTMMNDRFLYYPMLGMAPFAVLSVDGALDRMRPHFPSIAALTAAVVIFSYCGASWYRLDVWKNQLALWSDTIVKTEDGAWYGDNANYINYQFADTLVDLAQMQNRDGNWREARRLYYLALTYDPTHYRGLLLISLLHLNRNEPLLARPFILRIIDLYKRNADGHFLLGTSFDLTGETGLAKEEMQRALALDPHNVKAGNGLKRLEEKTRTTSPEKH